MGYSGKPYEDTGGKRAKSPNQRKGTRAAGGGLVKSKRTEETQ